MQGNNLNTLLIHERPKLNIGVLLCSWEDKNNFLADLLISRIFVFFIQNEFSLI
jgi:hypothetical protein